MSSEHNYAYKGSDYPMYHKNSNYRPRAFIRIITYHKEGGGHLLQATVFDNSWKKL